MQSVVVAPTPEPDDRKRTGEVSFKVLYPMRSVIRKVASHNKCRGGENR